MSLHWLGGVLGGSRPSTRANSSSRTRVRPSCTCGRSRTIQNCSKWKRWELDTIIERNALSTLIILMPPGWPADRAARWQNVLSGLQSTRWGSSLALVNSETVIAIGFFDDGGLSIVTGGKRRYFDY